MKTKPAISRGFTIIEVMLFLAVTGLMMVGVLAAIAGGINRQQYEDTISSLVDEFQGQYNLLDNVRSNRSDSLVCNSLGVGDTGGGATPRGSSACTVIGRLIRSDDKGESFTSEPVYSRQDLSVDPPDSVSGEAAYINWLQLTTASHDLIEDEVDIYRLPWSGNVYVNGNKSQYEFSLLILKLPSNGMVRTYSVESSTSALGDIIASVGASNEPLRVCVERGGFAGGGPSAGVRIEIMASNSTGVQRVATGDSGDRAC